MSAVCAQCRWFRPVKPASQLLAREYDTVESDVAQALAKIVEDEQKQRDGEADFKRAAAVSGKDRWLGPPVMSDYCGFQEDQGIYPVAEIKNADGLCTSFDPIAVEPHACTDCAHAVAPKGFGIDEARERRYAEMGQAAIAADAKPDTSQSLLETQRKGSASRKALEVSQIYQSRGRLQDPPEYVPWCNAFSTADTFVVCLLKNPHHTCSQWERQPEAAMTAENSGPQQPTTAATSPTASPLFTPPAGGAPAVFGAPTAFVPSVPPTPIPTPTTDDVLVAGPVPLTRHTLSSMIDMLQWILGVAFTSEDLEGLMAAYTAMWPTQGPAISQGMQAWLQLHQNAVAQGPDSSEFVREQYQAEFVGGLRTGADQVSALLIAAYDATNPPIALGNPPLTREAADSYLGILGFVDALMENRPWEPMSQATKETFSEQLGISYPTLAPAQQQWLASLPLEWARTRVLWATMSEPDRAAFKQQLIATFGGIVQSTPLLQQAGPPQTPVVSQSPVATGPSATPDTAQQDKTTDQLLAEIQDEQDRKERELAESDDPTAKEQLLQMKLQHQALNASMLSNIANMNYEAMKNVAQNLRA